MYHGVTFKSNEFKASKMLVSSESNFTFLALEVSDMFSQNTELFLRHCFKWFVCLHNSNIRLLRYKMHLFIPRMYLSYYRRIATCNRIVTNALLSFCKKKKKMASIYGLHCFRTFLKNPKTNKHTRKKMWKSEEKIWRQYRCRRRRSAMSFQTVNLACLDSLIYRHSVVFNFLLLFISQIWDI